MALSLTGTMPFREFMAAALYDPTDGYYTAGIRTVGRRGDFSTAATLSPALAGAIARWIRGESRRLPGRLTHLVEFGPGDGSLHRDVLRALGWLRRRTVRSHLVEVSPVLRERQRATLGRFARRTAWHDHPRSALDAAGGTALLFSNELVDAFPVTLLERTADGWAEVHVAFAPGAPAAESLRPVANPPDSAACALPFPPGQRIEVHDSYRRWMQSWLPAWHRGAMLTIDYGDESPDLYRRRPRGTLRGFRHHQPIAGPDLYANPGRTDLTADVNFSDLRRWGDADGLAFASLEPLHAFLRRRLPALPADSATARLADPHGPGGAFRCLVQTRGIAPIPCTNPAVGGVESSACKHHRQD